MSAIELSVIIARPVADVFDVLVHVENAARWSHAVEETILTPGPFGVGTRRRAIIRTFGGRTTENVMELTEFEPDRRLAMRSVSGFAFPVGMVMDLIPLGGKTRLDWTTTVEPTGILRIAGPALAAIVRRALAEDLANLKRMMEAESL